MPKFLVRWDAGFGESFDVEDHINQEMAEASAHESWLQEAERNAEFSAVPLTRDLAEEYELEFDDDE